MKRYVRFALGALTLAAGAGASLGNVASVTKYAGLDSYVGTPNSIGVGISNTGHIVGYTAQYGYDPFTGISYPPGTHSFLGTDPMTFVDMGVLGTDPPLFVFPRGETIVRGVNNLDQAAGSGFDETSYPPSNAFCWLPSDAYGFTAGLHRLPPLAVDARADAYGMNDNGMVAGTSQNAAFDPNTWPSAPNRPVVWVLASGLATVQDLDSTVMRPSGVATGVNNQGQVIGHWSLPSPNDYFQESFLYLPTPAYGLPAGINVLQALDPQSPWNTVFANPKSINESGQIVGSTSIYPGSGYPAIWLPSDALGLPAGATIFGDPIIWDDAVAKTGAVFFSSAEFSCINEAGDIVGVTTVIRVIPGPRGDRYVSEDHAFLLKNGQITLLDDLKGANSPWTRIFGPVCINDNGEISATATNVAGEIFAVKFVADADPSCPNGFFRHPSNARVCQNEKAFFSVWATAGGAEPLTYEWRHNGVPLTEGATPWGSFITGSNTASLQIANSQPDDSGDYDVVISNSCGTATSSSGNFNVIGEAVVITNPSDVHSCATGSSSFTAVATNGYPFWQVEDPTSPGNWYYVGPDNWIFTDWSIPEFFRFTATGFDTSDLSVSNFRGVVPKSLNFRCVFEVDSRCPQGESGQATLYICRADFNCDGTVSVADIFAFLNAWFGQFGTCTQDCSADLNADDAVAVADIFVFLNVWFSQFGTPCP